VQANKGEDFADNVLLYLLNNVDKYFMLYVLLRRMITDYSASKGRHWAHDLDERCHLR